MAPWIDGAFLLGVLLIVAFAGALTLRRVGPPHWRCQYCFADLAAWDLLLAHEEQHDTPCTCGPGAHHPSCGLRAVQH